MSEENELNPVDINPNDYLITPDDQKQALVDIQDYQRIANYHMQNNFANMHESSETLKDRYDNYLKNANDGNGMDITSGKPLKTFDEWLNS